MFVIYMNMAVFSGPSRQTILNCSFPVEQINDNEINKINNLVIRSWIIFFRFTSRVSPTM